MIGTPTPLWYLLLLLSISLELFCGHQKRDAYKTFLNKLPCIRNGQPLAYLCVGYDTYTTEEQTVAHQNQSGKTWIHNAAICGHTQPLRNAIINHISVTHADNDGMRPLHYAAHAPNSWEVVCILLPEYDYEQYDAHDQYGMTPLAYMILFDKSTAAAELLYRGASLQHSIAHDITLIGIAHMLNRNACLAVIAQCHKAMQPNSVKKRADTLQLVLQAHELYGIPDVLVELILSLLPCDVRPEPQQTPE